MNMRTHGNAKLDPLEYYYDPACSISTFDFVILRWIIEVDQVLGRGITWGQMPRGMMIGKYKFCPSSRPAQGQDSEYKCVA